jgi:hypothetical protein
MATVMVEIFFEHEDGSSGGWIRKIFPSPTHLPCVGEMVWLSNDTDEFTVAKILHHFDRDMVEIESEEVGFRGVVGLLPNLSLEGWEFMESDDEEIESMKTLAAEAQSRHIS